MKKKILLFFTFAAIMATGYWSCKKQQPSDAVPGNSAAEIMAKIQNEFTVEEFEIELTGQLNSMAIKTNPTDVSYNRTKEVSVVINDLEVEMVTGSTGKISKSELQRVYAKVKNDVWAAAHNEFAAGKDRVLGFLLDEGILLPTAAAGTVQNVTVKLSGIIGNGVKQLPGCSFQQDYTWYWNDSAPPDTMLSEIEAILNATAPPCIQNYFSTCPEPGKTEKKLPNGSALYKIDGGICMSGTPFICPIGSVTLSCKQPCPDWYIATSDLQAMADNARQTALDWEWKVLEQAPCTAYEVAPAPRFEIGYFEEIDGSDKMRSITATYYYYGCGPCRGKSIRIK